MSKKAEVFIKIVKNDQSDKDQVGRQPNKQASQTLADELSNDDMSNDDTLPNDSTSSQQSPPLTQETEQQKIHLKGEPSPPQNTEADSGDGLSEDSPPASSSQR